MENRISRQEVTQNKAQHLANNPTLPLTGSGATPPNSTYPAGQLKKDEDARTSIITANQRDRWNKQNPPGSAAHLAGKGKQKRAQGAAQADEFADKIGAKKPAAPTADKKDVIAGRSAEECINKWREAAKQEMMRSGLKDEIKRTQAEAAAHAGPPTPSPAAQANATAQAEAARTEAKMNGETPGTPEHARATAAHEAATIRALNTQNAADREASAANRLPCLQEMDRRVTAGTNNPDGRTFDASMPQATL